MGGYVKEKDRPTNKPIDWPTNQRFEIHFESFFADVYTWRKQLVVCPMPVGSTFSPSSELMAVLLPLLVRPKKATYESANFTQR